MPSQVEFIQKGFMNYAQKQAICKRYQRNPRLTHVELAKWAKDEYKLAELPHRTTIGRILSDPTKFSDERLSNQLIRRSRFVKNSVLETALANWVLQMQHARLSINGDIIKAKGREFAKALNDESLQFSNGWLSSFCKRNHFRHFQSHGESGDAQMENTEEKLAQIKERIAQYELCDVYNMDETGLFYNMAPDKTIARRQIEGIL